MTAHKSQKGGAKQLKIAEFDHKQYRKLAQLIHDRFCEDYSCTYGRETPEMREHDQEVLREHVRVCKDLKMCSCWRELDCYNCQYAVDAENIAARVQFGRGGKVRK